MYFRCGLFAKTHNTRKMYCIYSWVLCCVVREKDALNRIKLSTDPDGKLKTSRVFQEVSDRWQNFLLCCKSQESEREWLMKVIPPGCSRWTWLKWWVGANPVTPTWKGFLCSPLASPSLINSFTLPSSLWPQISLRLFDLSSRESTDLAEKRVGLAITLSCRKKLLVFLGGAD